MLNNWCTLYRQTVRCTSTTTTKSIVTSWQNMISAKITIQNHVKSIGYVQVSEKEHNLTCFRVAKHTLRKFRWSTATCTTCRIIGRYCGSQRFIRVKSRALCIGLWQTRLGPTPTLFC